MPELPDVEVFKQYLDSTALHQRIDRVRVEEARLLQGVSAKRLRQELEGRELAAARRHGKWLFVATEASGDGGSSPWLALHFGMTGFLAYFRDPERAPDHVRLRLDFADGSGDGYHLAYDDQRLFGEIGLLDDPDDLIADRGLGPDALGIGWETFRERLESRRGAIKSAMMNQEVLAGIGNVYSDEILFQAKVHPKKPLQELSGRQLRRIHRRMGRVFDAAIEARCRPEDFPEGFLLPHREVGSDCPAGCGGRVEKIEVSGRSGRYCPRCQRE